MAIRPSRQALEELNNARANKKQQLAQAYAELGGRDTALTPNYAKSNPTPTASIPTLEKAVVSQYEEAENSGGIQNIAKNMKPDSLLNLANLMETVRGQYGDAVQTNANIYNELRNAHTRKVVENNPSPEITTTPTIMGMGNGVYGLPTTAQANAGVTREDLQRLYDEENRGKAERRARSIAESHPVLGSAMASISRPIESAEGVLQNLAEYATGKPLSQTYTPSNVMREQVNEGIESGIGRGAYGVVNSMSDMTLAMLLAGGNPKLASALMGVEKASDVMNDANARGLSPEQILAEGGLSGVSTGITERFPMGRLGTSANIFASAASEGAQEGLEDIADNFFDDLVTKYGGNSEKSTRNIIYNTYIEAGYTPEEAKKATESEMWKQVGLDAILGAITGGTMQLGGNFIRGNNAITGKPRTQAEGNNSTVNAIDDVPEAPIPTLQNEETAEPEARTIPTYDSINEEQQIQSQREAELKALQEAYNPGSEGAVDVIRRQKNEVIGRLNNNDPLAGEAVSEFIERANWLKENRPEMAEFLDAEINDVLEQSRGWVTDFENTRSPEWDSQPELNIDPVEERLAAQDFLNSLPENPNLSERENTVNKLTDIITNAKDKVLNALDTNDPFAGENASDFLARVNYLAQNNPDMREFFNSVINEVLDHSEGWAIDYNNNTQTIPTVNSNEARNAENTIRQDAQALLYDIEAGNVLDVNKAARDLMNNIMDIGNRYPELQPTLKNIWSDFFNKSGIGRQQNPQATNNVTENVATPKPRKRNVKGKQVQNVAPQTAQNVNSQNNVEEDVANIQNVRDAQAMLESEIDRLSETYPLNTQFFGGGSEDTDVDMDEESITDQRRREFHTGIYKDSKVSTNSFPRSKALNKTEMNTVLNKEQKQYEAVTHEATLERATKELKEDGYKASVEDILTKNEWDAVDTDKAMLCAFKSAKEARYKTKHGADPKQAWQQTVDLFKTIREHATVGGQAIEALKKWASRTPEGKLGKAIAFARELAETADPKSEAAKQVAKQNNVVFTDEFMTEFLEKAHQYDDQEVSFAKQARLDQELAHMVWDQIPKDWKSKFTSLWMDNLLASFRTLISRNVGGNTGKYLLDQTATKAIAGPIDTLISRLTGGRTTTGLTKEGFKVATQGLRQGAFNTTMDYWGANLDPDKVTKFKDLVKEFGDINTAKENFFADAKVSNRSGSNESDFNETLKNNRTVFETKLFKTYDKLIKYGLAVSDNMFYKAVYDQTMYELDTLRKNGKLEKALQDLSDEKFETWAKATATAQGLEAVYQNDSELSKGATKIKEGIGKMAKDMIGVDFVSNAAFPFLRTPMNVIRTNLEFSPLGIVRNGVQTIKEIRNNLKNNRAAFTTDTSGGSFNQGRFVRETSRNIVGSLLFGLALVMKNAGYLTGGYSDDDREKQAQKDAGMQEYAFVNPLNGNQYSVDWIPALGSNLVGAAAFDDAFRKPDQSTLDAVINGAKAGSKSLFEQSALQGLQRLVGQQSYNNEDSVIDNVINTVTSTASSAAVPAFVRQTAAILDPYKRNTYGMGGRETVINNLIAGIPILRQNLQPRIGSNGQPMEQNAGRNLAQKMFDNLVNPAMVTVPSALEDPVRDEATRLFEATKDTNAYQPKIGLSYLNVDGHQATTEEYTEFLQIADSAMNQIAGNFIQTPFYSHLTDEQKVNALNNIYGAVQRVERAKYLGLDKDFDGADKAYAEGGEEGLLNFITAQNALSDLGIANNEENRNAVLQTLNANGGDLSALTSQYQGAVGHTNTGLDDIMNNEYRDMLLMLSDDNMRDLRFDLNSVVNGVEFNSMTGLEKDYQGAKKAYDNGGVNGLAEYMFPAAVLNQYGMDNSEKNRQVVMDAYNEGGASAVRTQLNAMQTFANSDYGEGLISDYNHATQYLPTLNPQQFTNLYDDINQQSKGETGFNNITQQEIIDYLNRDPNAYNSETALQYWNAFDQNAGTDKQWKKVPVLQNGTWVLKKEDRPVTIPTVTTPTTTAPSTTTQTSNSSTITPASIGQYGRGNIDLYNRPQFIQPDGSISTVNSMSFNFDGKEVLIPTIAYDRNGKPYQMTNQEAIDRYRQTGEYLGKFDTVEEADAYAQALHLQQEMLYR